MDAGERIEALTRDASRGASEITREALDALEALHDEAADPRARLADACARLIEAHPAMAPLVNLADELLDGLEAEGREVFDRLAWQADRRGAALAEQGARLVEDGDEVATYSRSGTVLEALQRAHDQGRRFTVLVSEARPGDEGLSVARELARANIPVMLATDAALGALVGETDLLLVGADAVCRAGLVNKTGTGWLAREAARAGVPAYVLAGTDKLLPAAYRRRPPLTKTGSLGYELPAGVHASAPLFECEPLSPFEAVVTEEGPRDPAAVLEQIGERELHPALRERL